MRNFGAPFRILVTTVLTGLVALTTGVFAPTGLAQPAVGALTLSKSASPQVGLQSGDTVTYTFLVTNVGAATVSDIGVTELVFTGSGGAPEADCSSTTLQSGQSTTCTAPYDVTDADQAACSIDNTAVATGKDPQMSVKSPPASATVVTNCAGNLAGSAFLPAALGSSELGGLFALAPLAVGSLGLGSLGSLGALGAVGAWALSTPYQPPAAARCQDAPYPIVPYLIPPCPKESNPNEPSPAGP